MTTLTIDDVRNALRFVAADDRDTWVRMAMAVKSEHGDAGFDVWDEWSQTSDRYDATDARGVWKSIRSDGKVTLGTLLMAAKASGWTDDGARRRPTPEELAERQRLVAEHARREVDEVAREKAAASENAHALWRAAVHSPTMHPYLTRKGLVATQTMRQIDAARCAEILGYAPRSGNALLEGELLVLPIKIGDDISSCELIDKSGRKTALYGRGTKSGGYWASAPLPIGQDAACRILLGEGAATVLSAAQATGDIGVAALSASNLAKVAVALRDRYPNATLAILADLSKTTGEPEPQAVAAAREVAGVLVVPHFESGQADDAKDMNDLARLHGTDAVRNCIDKATHHQLFIDQKPGKDNAGAVTVWPDPEPIVSTVDAQPYPIDALPEIIRDAVMEVAEFVKAPLPLVATSAIAAVSLAVQAHVDVQRAQRLSGPTGLFLLTIADSGERKSTCDGFFTRPIREFEAAQAELGKALLRDHRADAEAWETKRAGIKERMRQQAKDGKPTAEMEVALRELENEAPESPKVPRLLYSDATPEALAFGLAKQWPSGGVVSAEAGVVFGSHGMGKDSVMRNLAQLNQLWDGNSLTIDRRSSESFTVSGARLTVALQIQEATLRSFFDRSGALARGTGFLARFLVSWPTSTQGFRPFSEPPADWPKLARFHRQLIDLLERPVPLADGGGLLPQLLAFDEMAKAAWIDYYDQVEGAMQVGGELEDVRDVASKSADNAARLAALFQVFDRGVAPIEAGVFAGASRIAAWHLNEARRFFGDLSLPTGEIAAIRLDEWLRGYCRRERVEAVPMSRVLQFGPGSLRNKEALEAAVSQLEIRGRMRREQSGRQRLIAVHPDLLRQPEGASCLPI